MLGNDRFSFETPNVIDPGDMPPSRPNREQDRPTSAFAPTRGTTNTSLSDGQVGTPGWLSDDPRNDSVQEYNQVRESAARLLRDIADLDLQPQTEALAPYDPYDDDDNQSYPEENGNGYLPRGSHWNSGFNKEKLSLYAASVGKNDAQPLSLHRTVKLHDSRGKTKNRVSNRLIPYCRRLFTVLKPLIAIGAFIGVVIASMQVYNVVRNNGSEGSSSSVQNNRPVEQTERYQLLIRVLADNGISSTLDLKTPGTPQYKAANWLANDDGEIRDIPETLSLSDDLRTLQRYILAVLYFGTGGKQQWINSLDFVTAVDECAWYTKMGEPQFADRSYAIGVECNIELQVISIFIPNNGLSGTIPVEIRFLKYLEMLALQHNSLSGDIPYALEDMSQLTYLNLNYNQFGGTIPSYFGDFANLVVLGLSNNQLTGPIPATMGTLGKLKTLWLDNNNLSADIGFAKHLSALEYLYLDNSGFKGELGDTFFSNLIHLRHIDVSDNEIMGEVQLSLVLNHATLKVADLANNSFTGSFPVSAGSSTHLEYLSLRENKFVGSLPADIGSLVNLKHLDLQDNAFTGEIPNNLGGIRGLRYLFLGGNNFTSTIPPLNQLASLRELSLSDLNLVEIPYWIGYLKELQFVDLQRNKIEGSISTDIWNLPHLQFLILNDNMLSGDIPDTDIGGQKLKFLALHRNDMSGSAKQVCAVATNLTAIAVDCSIDCPQSCCASCCRRGDANCFDDEVNGFLLNTQGQWEFKFTHSQNSLDPQILDITSNNYLLPEENP